MKHPNAALLETLYAHFVKGDTAAMLALCADNVTFQVPGKSKLAGKYTRETFPTFATGLKELSGGTHLLEVHDILASDRHGLVLTSEKLVRGGKPVELRAVHVWRIEGGKPVAWYAYPRDLYTFDATWV